MAVEMKPLREVTQEAIEILSREIGIANTIRFINQFTTGRGNYTEEREHLFEGMSLEDIIQAIRDRRSK